MTENTQTYEQLHQDIALQLKTLKAKLKVHAQSKADKPESWVPIADLNRIKQALDEAVIALAYIEL